MIKLLNLTQTTRRAAECTLVLPERIELMFPLYEGGVLPPNDGSAGAAGGTCTPDSPVKSRELCC
jgi:hypothetical protein